MGFIVLVVKRDKELERGLIDGGFGGMAVPSGIGTVRYGPLGATMLKGGGTFIGAGVLCDVAGVR